MIIGRTARTLALGALAGATILAPFSYHRASAASPRAKVSTVVVGWDISEAKTLDPGREYEFTGMLVDHALYDTLITIHGSDVAHIQPDLATSWKVSNGGTVFTFTLRQGVKFVSGNPLTADDVVFSYLRFMNLKDNPSTLVTGLKDVKALNPSTVQITLSAPDVSFLAAMESPNFAIVDSKLVKQQGGTDGPDAAKTDKATAFLDANAAGTGPYILKEWTRNTRIVLSRNPNYWGPTPYFQEVILDGVKDAQTQKLQLQKGDAQLAFGLTSDQIASLRADHNVKVVLGPTQDYLYLAMNVSAAVSKPFSNPLVRLAVRYAVDYDGIIKNLLNGGGTQPASVIPTGYVGNSVAENNAQRLHTDVAKAKALLVKAGYPNGFTTTFAYPTNYPFDGVNLDALAAKLVDDFKKVGITAQPKAEQVAIWLQDFRARKFQIGLSVWGADYLDAFDNLSYFGPGGAVGLRVNYTKDGNLAALIAKGDTVANAEQRGAIYNQVQQQFLKTSPWVGIVQPAFPVGVRAEIKGYQYAPIWKVDFATLSK
jgi:peptide/nickel transport system substrate-binding protein